MASQPDSDVTSLAAITTLQVASSHVTCSRGLRVIVPRRIRRGPPPAGLRRTADLGGAHLDISILSRFRIPFYLSPWPAREKGNTGPRVVNGPWVRDPCAARFFTMYTTEPRRMPSVILTSCCVWGGCLAARHSQRAPKGQRDGQIESRSGLVGASALQDTAEQTDPVPRVHCLALAIQASWHGVLPADIL